MEDLHPAFIQPMIQELYESGHPAQLQEHISITNHSRPMNGHVPITDVEMKPADDFPNGPGIYKGVPAEEYHGLEGRASSTVLRKIVEKSPAHAKAQMDGEYEPTSAMKKGTRLHEAILEPARFNERHAVSTQCQAITGSGSQCGSSGSVPYRRDDGAVIWFCGRSSHQPDLDPLNHDCSYCGAPPEEKCWTESDQPTSPHAARKEAARTVETPDGEVKVDGRADVEELKESDMEQIEDMYSALENHEAASNLLFELDGPTELTILWEHPGTGVPCKSRIDRVVSHETLGIVAVDYKTTRNAAPGTHEFGRSVMKGRYDMQAAFYMDALAKLGLPCENFIFVAQEKSPPYDVTCQFIPQGDLLEKGRKDFVNALRRYKHCAKTGTWPGYADGVMPVTVPHWHYDE